MEETSKTRSLRFMKISGTVLVLVLAAVWVFIQGYSATRTGVGSADTNSVQAKNLWDWMSLLLIPACLTGGAMLLNRSKKETERQRSDHQAALEREISLDGQQEAALQAYIDRMSELLLKEKLSKFSPDEVRNVAKIRTLTVLRGLDAKRKGAVLLFLKDSGLIDREAVIDLCGADLRGMSVPFANLSRVNLAEANLSGADLQGTNLSKSYLSGTDLSSANLNGANLNAADLFDANLNGANLTQTKLSKANLNGSDLRGVRLNEADLREADLSGVNLNVGDLVRANLRGAKLGGAKLLGADLSQADLSGTEITKSELEQAKSLAGTTMPDGSKHN